MALVFQYGSNCSESQINSKDRLCGDAEFVAIAETVDDYQLAFDVWSTKRECAASDIVARLGSKVWGVLYEVPDYLIDRKTAATKNRKSLDAIEGEGTNYKREPICKSRQSLAHQSVLRLSKSHSFSPSFFRTHVETRPLREPVLDQLSKMDYAPA